MKKNNTKYLDISQQELADSIGISRVWLNQIIRHQRMPSIKTAKKIVAATNGKITFLDLRPDLSFLIQHNE